MSVTSDQAIKTFARNILERRRKLGISQEKLALKAGLDRTYISGIEQSRRNPSLKNIAKIARALDTTPSALLELTK